MTTFGTIRALDTGEIEPLPIRIHPVGRPVEFYMEAEADGGDLRYNIGYVAMFGPPGANAFVLESARLENQGKDRLFRFRYYHIDRSRHGNPRSERA